MHQKSVATFINLRFMSLFSLSTAEAHEDFYANKIKRTHNYRNPSMETAFIISISHVKID